MEANDKSEEGHVQTGLEGHLKPLGEGVKIVSFNISNWQLLLSVCVFRQKSKVNNKVIYQMISLFYVSNLHFLAAATSVSVLWVLIGGGNYTVWS